MNIDEKRQLKARINHSVDKYIKKRIKYRISLGAAIIVVLFSIGVSFNNFDDTSSIEDFAKRLDGFSSTTNDPVKLLLNNNQDIKIEQENAVIAYSKTGEEINVEGAKSVNQKTSNTKNQVYNTLIVPYGKRSEIQLSDGSKVWLNSGSKLVFPVLFKGNRREVFLEGEGIFEVAHSKNQPFIVKSNNHEVEVLGTVFNISNYPDDGIIKTVLKSGSVQLNYKSDSFFSSKKSIKIIPGTMAVFSKNEKNMTTETVAVEKYFSWREGIFMFQNDSFKSIARKISRYYNIEINIEDKSLAEELFSGNLDVKESVNQVLKTIQLTTDFNYIINNNSITIN